MQPAYGQDTPDPYSDPGMLERAVKAVHALGQRDPIREVPDYYLDPSQMPRETFGAQALKNVSRAFSAAAPPPVHVPGIAGTPGMDLDASGGLGGAAPAISSIADNPKMLARAMEIIADTRRAGKELPVMASVPWLNQILEREPESVTRLYHGTRGEFKNFQPEKSGGIVSFAHNPGTAMDYSQGGGGGRGRMRMGSQLLVDPYGGNIYQPRATGSKEFPDWQFDHIGIWDPAKANEGHSFRTQDVLPNDPRKSPPPSLDWQEAEDAKAGGDWFFHDKTGRVEQRDFGNLNLLDTTTRPGLQTLADLKPGGSVGLGISRAAQDTLRNGYGGVGPEIWMTTKSARAYPEQMEQFISPLRSAGYDGMFHADDGHTTTALFDTGLQKQLSGEGKIIDPRTMESLIRKALGSNPAAQGKSIEDILKGTRPNK